MESFVEVKFGQKVKVKFGLK